MHHEDERSEQAARVFSAIGNLTRLAKIEREVIAEIESMPGDARLKAVAKTQIELGFFAAARAISRETLS